MSPAVAIATAYTCAMHKRVPPRWRVTRGCAVVSCVLCVRGTVCVVLFARYCGKVCTVVPSRAPFRMAEWKFSGMRNSEWRMEVVLAFAPAQQKPTSLRTKFLGEGGNLIDNIGRQTYIGFIFLSFFCISGGCYLRPLGIGNVTGVCYSTLRKNSKKKLHSTNSKTEEKKRGLQFLCQASPSFICRVGYFITIPPLFRHPN